MSPVFDVVDLTVDDDEDKFVDRRYVCDRYGVSPRTVSRWQAAGKLTPYRIAGTSTVRYKRSQVDSLARQTST